MTVLGTQFPCCGHLWLDHYLLGWFLGGDVDRLLLKMFLEPESLGEYSVWLGPGVAAVVLHAEWVGHIPVSPRRQLGGPVESFLARPGWPGLDIRHIRCWRRGSNAAIAVGLSWKPIYSLPSVTQIQRRRHAPRRRWWTHGTWVAQE